MSDRGNCYRKISMCRGTGGTIIERSQCVAVSYAGLKCEVILKESSYAVT